MSVLTKRQKTAASGAKSAETKAKLDAIKAIWKPGMSGAAIAAALPFPATRNAVIGLFDRHADYLAPCSLNARPVATLTEAQRKQRQRAKIKQANVQHRNIAIGGIEGVTVVRTYPTVSLPVAEDAPLPEAAHLTLMQLDSTTCRWPHGDKDFTFCGASTGIKSPYCAYHARLAMRRVVT